MDEKKGSYIDSGWGLDDPSAIVEELKAGFQRFLEGICPSACLRARRHQLAGGQHPQVALLACSDSRVPVEVIFDAGFGDLFVIRNAGNTNTFGSAGSIEYAVLDLNVRVLVVMSHQGCGAVKAAYLKETSFSASLSELVTDIKTGLNSHGISTDDLELQRCCLRHASITATSLMDTSAPIFDAVQNKRLMIQPAFLHIDPLAISWLPPLYGRG